VIFVDSNIPMYLVGAAHPHREAALQPLEAAIVRRERLVTDVEALQEILHRFVAIGRLDAIQPAFEVFLDLVDEVLPVTLPELERARTPVLSGRDLSARDAPHLAMMEAVGIRRILSFDADLDRYPGLQRLP
jgi:uncharacterized protein